MSQIFFNVLTASLLAITAILILAGNIFVLLILQRIKTSVYNEVTKLFMRSLTVSDLMVGIFLVIPNVGRWANGGTWPYGKYFPLVYLKVHVFVLLSGLLSLMVITIDRYMAVVYALRYPYLMNKKRAKIVIAIVWGLSLVFAASAQSSTGASREHLGVEQNRSAKGNESSLDYQLQLDSENTNLDRNQNLDITRDIDGSTASLWTNIFLLVALPIVTIIILSIKLYAGCKKTCRSN